MNRQEAIRLLKALQLQQRELGPAQAHREADGVLCALLTMLGCYDVVAEYHGIQKRYGQVDTAIPTSRSPTTTALSPPGRKTAA